MFFVVNLTSKLDNISVYFNLENIINTTQESKITFHFINFTAHPAAFVDPAFTQIKPGDAVEEIGLQTTLIKRIDRAYVIINILTNLFIRCIL